MSVLCLNVCRLCVPNIMNLGVCFMKKLYLSKLACLLDTASNFALFSVSSLKDKKLIKSKPTQKLKHENSILESFEYFCQISSKSIVIILSYTVQSWRVFLRHSVVMITHHRQWAMDCQTSQLHTMAAPHFSSTLYNQLYIFKFRNYTYNM